MSWLAVVVVGATWATWPYFGYPISLQLLAWLSPRAPLKRGAGESQPSVSVIIAVHNGRPALARKLENTLALTQGRDCEVIVASDGSTDGTDEIAAHFEDRGVLLVRTGARVGKEAAQAAAIARAKGDLIVFTDVTAELEGDALRQLVAPFEDPSVGSVSSEDVVASDGGEGTYVRFEMALRRLESRTTSLVGNSGSAFALRRALCTPWPPDLASDFRSALEAGRRGFRAVTAPARVHVRALDDPSLEWPRKVRTVRRGIAVLSAYSDLLHPRFGRVAFSLWGHKVARFTAPLGLLVALVASAVAARDSSAAAGLLGVQALGYLLGALGLLWPHFGRLRLARLASFFLLVNASVLVAWAHHLSGQRAVTWQPTQRA